MLSWGERFASRGRMRSRERLGDSGSGRVEDHWLDHWAALGYESDHGCLCVSCRPERRDAVVGVAERNRGEQSAGGLRIEQQRIDRMLACGFEIADGAPQPN